MPVRMKHDNARRKNSGEHYSLGVHVGSDGDTLVVSYWRDGRLAGCDVSHSGRDTTFYRIQKTGRITVSTTGAPHKGVA